ncbi:MAG: flagellar hook-basal body complex protein FliE [Pseudomonadota bacterium]
MQIKALGSDPLSLLPPLKKAADARPGFQETLTDSMKQVNQLQLKSHAAVEELATGGSSNLHETMIAIQKAEISFKMLAQVRNKVVSAYQEVMRMSV